MVRDVPYIKSVCWPGGSSPIEPEPRLDSLDIDDCLIRRIRLRLYQQPQRPSGARATRSTSKDTTLKALRSPGTLAQTALCDGTA